MSLLSYRAYARHRGVTLGAVQKAIKAGRIKTVMSETNGRPMIDPESADRDWEANTDESKRSLLFRPDGQPGQHTTLQEPPEPDAPLPDDNQAYREARAQREQLKLKRETLELQEFEGSLINVDEARRMAFTAFRALRDQILNVPARVKDQCAASDDALQIEQMIEGELTAVLAEFDVSKVTQDADEQDDEDAA